MSLGWVDLPLGHVDHHGCHQRIAQTLRHGGGCIAHNMVMLGGNQMGAALFDTSRWYNHRPPALIQCGGDLPPGHVCDEQGLSIGRAKR